MDSLTYSSHFALSFSSGILFKNIFIRVTKLPVFKLLPTEKQLFHGYNNSEYNVLISCKFVPRNWVKLLHSSWEAEMMPYHTCFFPAKNLSVVYNFGPIHMWIHVKILKNILNRNPELCLLFKEDVQLKTQLMQLPEFFQAFFFATYICCVFFAFISSFHGYNNLYEIHIFINSSSPPSGILRTNLMS